jgi:hypothetical protein
MARISFFMMQEPGHILPTLRVATFLRNCGHEVSYVTVERFRGFLESLGFQCVMLPFSDRLEPDELDIWTMRRSGIMIGSSLAAGSAGSSVSWTEILDRQDALGRPDLLVCDRCIVHKFRDQLRRRVGRPVVSLSTFLPHKDVTGFREIVLCPMEFDFAIERGSSEGRYYCEPSVWRDRASSGLDIGSLGAQSPPAAFLADSRPLVYCTFGTQTANYTGAPAVLQRIIDAFVRLPSHRLLVAAGPLCSAIEHEGLPESVLVVPSVPQLDVLARASLVITHGGLGTLKEAIMEEVPTLVFPFMFDQPANGRRVEYHGIGRMCPQVENCTSDWIRRAVSDMADDPALQERLGNLGTVFRAREAESRAGHLLHGLVSPGS